MAPRPRPGDRPDLPHVCSHEGSVLVLLYEREDSLVVPLTCRTQTVEMHKGQICLPGGAREPQDSSFAETALRETREELGIPEAAIEVLGSLTPLYIPPSCFCVYPYVGCTRRAFPLRPDPSEVAEVIEARLDRLLDPAAQECEIRYRNGKRYEVPVYRVGNHRVWGATAMMLAEFLALLRAAQALPASAL